MQEVQETQVPSLGGEDPLEEKVVTHSSILTGKIPWTEKPGRLQSMGSQRADTTEQLSPPQVPKGSLGIAAGGWSILQMSVRVSCFQSLL